MKLNFVVNEVAGGWEPTDTRLGGTEESVVEWASRLAAKGIDVSVYRNSRGLGTLLHRGVKYKDRLQYLKEAGDGRTVNVKSIDIPRLEPTYYLTNEMNARDLDLSRFDGVILPSKWALDNLGVHHPNISILAHGYDETKIYPDTKIKNQCLYASSPDRGLAFLAEHWHEVAAQVPDATLIVTYGGYIDAPNVINMGDASADLMSELYRTSNFWLHPCNGGELYCISGIKAQAAQALPVYFPVMALQETVEWGIRAKPETFVNKLVDIMRSPGKQREIINHAAAKTYPTWDTTTDALLRILGIKPWLIETTVIEVVELFQSPDNWVNKR